MDTKTNTLWFSLLHNGPYSGPELNYPDVSTVPGIGEIEKNSEVILQELRGYLGKFVMEDQFNVTMVEKPKSWKVRSLRVWGVEMYEIQKHFQKTMDLLSRIDGVVNVGFNLLEPNARIKPHYGDTNSIIRCHLGLIIPRDKTNCGIKVNGETRHWEQSKVLGFTDAYQHEAWNDSDQRRVILLFDIIKPEYRLQKNKICGVVLASLYLQKAGNVFPKLYHLDPKYVRPITYPVSFMMRVLFPIRNYLKR